ncbi:hypothetical protein DDZ14_05350 [Maritimibacter sp. 55A14]|uniref:hypothetical protein n=1 Tax=Maritimibacter sp. 55A14 TaxID=2174844 RepID=UPI000D60EFE2|nr:hypothetical protein [Maritimibacter sp. 55A14]PWE33613.1 hypothetical protein DDZ14_05350 [Maritimibacter sp. 55A14]
MVLTVTGAAFRAALVMLLIATPSLILPDIHSETHQIVAAVALCCAGITFIEYTARFPSLVEFRFAPPFNRIRFVALLINVVLLSLLCRQITAPSATGVAVTQIGTLIGHGIDFQFSPVRLIGLMLPPEATYGQVELLRAAAGISYLISLMMTAVFAILMRLCNWPLNNRSFNVWTNMPNFDPTAGGDVVEHLVRDGRVNVLLGLSLPFVTPMFVMLAAGVFDRYAMANHQTLIWTVAIWAFIPAGLVMRGIALGRVADMLQRKRSQAVEERSFLAV